MPRIRQLPEDFVVEEIPLYQPQGSGGHTFLQVEKRLRTTEEVARQLAASAGVANREVGFAGRKDRRGVTRQWFSVPELDPDRALDLSLEGASVLRAVRHPHKLRVGQLRGNRFELVVREVAAEQGRYALERLQEAGARGFPNRFGPQRFGRDGRNAERGAEILLGRRRMRDRRTARFLVSALQSAVFNETLERRTLPLDVVRTGDVATLHDRGALFRVEDPAAETPRVERFEISPTGPIFGSKMMQPEGETLAEETDALAAFGLDRAKLEARMGRKLRGGRRALRARPESASAAWIDDSSLRLDFALPAGSYATVLLEVLFSGTGLEEGPLQDDGSDLGSTPPSGPES